MSKMDQRKAFCASMGWQLQRREQHGQHRIIGPTGEVLMETGGNYQSGYLDGLMDGLMATPFERAHGRSKEAES